MNNLAARVLTAIVLLPAVVWWLLWAESGLFAGILAVVCLMAVVEMLRMAAMPGWIGFALVAAISFGMLARGIPSHTTLLLQFTSWLFLALILARGDALQTSIQRLALAQWMFVWLYLFAWSVMLTHGRPDGPMFIAGACVGVWVADIAAYFVGRTWGRRKLMPSVSPGKTVEGAAAAVAFGIPAASVFWHLGIQLNLSLALPLAGLLVIAGIVGDLAESAFKRALAVKDSSNWLPGHGGLLDRMDALMLAVPASGLAWIALT